jgi:hypothetical protein
MANTGYLSEQLLNSVKDLKTQQTFPDAPVSTTDLGIARKDGKSFIKVTAITYHFPNKLLFQVKTKFYPFYLPKPRLK